MSFSALTRDLSKSKSLIQAGRSALETAGSPRFPSSENGVVVGGDKDIVSIEDEFGELAKWCCQQPGQSVSNIEANIIEETATEEESNGKMDQESDDEVVRSILIRSVGVVKQRYRKLRRDEEQMDSRKASRLKRKFNEEKRAPLSTTAVSVRLDSKPEVPAVHFDITIDKLSYSKFCTDYDYKRSLINAVKLGRQEKRVILLRTGKVENDDHRRDGRQILKQLFMQTSHYSDFSCIPSIDEVENKMQMIL